MAGKFLQALVRTLDARLADYADDTDVTTERFTQPALYLFWHENILLPFVTRSRFGMTLLVSQHRDANWLGWMARDFAYHTVRGSSTKGGLKAILQYRKEHQNSSLVVTPDGTYSQGAMFTMDLGNEAYTAWPQNVAGDALTAWSLKDCEVVGDILESIMAFCQLAAEWHTPAAGLKGMDFVTVPVAYQVWQYIEAGV